MIIRLNPTGTQLRRERLVVRLDIYPEPGDATYPQQYVDVLDPRTEEPTGEKRLNPMLCHSIAVDPAWDRAVLITYIQGILDKGTLGELDRLLADPADRKAEIGALMKTRLGSNRTVKSANLEQVNTRLAGLEVTV